MTTNTLFRLVGQGRNETEITPFSTLPEIETSLYQVLIPDNGYLLMDPDRKRWEL